MAAPYTDPSFQIWTLNDAHPWIPRADEWYELHPPSWYGDINYRRSADYIAHLAQFKGPVWMQQPHPDIPSSRALPMREMIERHCNGFGSPRSVFGSTFAYMICHAIERGFNHIGIYGVDLADQTEYFPQRETAGYWIGMARGHGITITLPEQCLLLPNVFYGYDPSLTDSSVPRDGHLELVRMGVPMYKRLIDPSDLVRSLAHENAVLRAQMRKLTIAC